MKYFKLSFWLQLLCVWCTLNDYLSIRVLNAQSLVSQSKSENDFQITGVFSNSLYFNTTSQQCRYYSVTDIQSTQAMIYAIQKLVNKNSKILPDVNLGWTIIDSCLSRELAVSSLASVLLLNGQQSLISRTCANHLNTSDRGYSCTPNSTKIKSNHQPVIGIIGEKSDSITSALASFSSSLRYSQIGYISFNSVLNNRKLFPYFYRTSALASTQIQSFITLLKRFNWDMMPIVLAGNAEIINILPLVTRLQQIFHICFYPVIKFYDNYTMGDIIDVILLWKNRSRPQVVSLFGQEAIIFDLLKQAEIHNLTGITFIGGITWLTSSRVQTIRADIIGGALGIAFNSTTLEQFSNYLHKLDFCNNKDNPWFQKAWRHQLLQAGLDVETILRNCKIDTKFKQQYFREFYHINMISALIIDSVLAYSHALHNSLGCNNITCRHQSNNNFERDKFNRILSKLSFTGVTSSDVTFRSTGIIEISFDVVNLQKDTSTSLRRVKSVKIGYWSKVKGLVLEEDKIIWNGNRSWFDTPWSTCSQDCSPGYYQYEDTTIATNLRLCCWKCRKCPSNQVSNTTNARQCIQCSAYAEPNANSTSCVDFPIVNVKLDSALSIIIIIVALFHFICLTFIWIIMIIKRNTPVVKGSNFILVNILLFFIGMCIPTALLHLFPISIAMCQARIFAATITQVGIYLTILCKTNQISMIFKIAMVRKKRPLCLNKSINQVILIFMVLVFVCCVLICLTILLPIEVHRQPTISRQIQLICYVPNSYNAINSALWLGIIGLLSLILAFRARLLPENFNESKYIFFSMVFICIIACSNVPATIVLAGIIADSINALLILAFGISPMLCLFLPKIYIIIYQPELNTKQEAIASITSFTFSNINHLKV